MAKYRIEKSHRRVRLVSGKMSTKKKWRIFREGEDKPVAECYNSHQFWNYRNTNGIDKEDFEVVEVPWR